jgi:hypothetical protein
MAPAISLFCLNVLEDAPKQHEGSVMKAILFAVASIFVLQRRPAWRGLITKAGPNQTLPPVISPALRGPPHRSLSPPICEKRSSTRSRHAAGARPARWCGWWMRTQKGGGPELNPARNWRNWGRPSGPRVGAVVVWSHHVGMITGRTASGQWIVKSGNDSGRVRERPRSVAGAVFRI